MHCKSTENLSEATTKILVNDANLKKIELQFGIGCKFSHGALEEFTRAMENSSITNLQLIIFLESLASIKIYQAEFTRAMETSSIANLQIIIFLESLASIKKYQAFIKRIVQCHSIHDLILWGDFSINPLAFFLEALSHNSAIENLKIVVDLYKLRIGFFRYRQGYCIGRKAIASIAKSLRSKASSLKSLHISTWTNDGLSAWTNDGLSAVMEALHNYPSLKNLNVSNCSIGTEGAKSIGQLLRSAECGIEELELSNNDIRDEGFDAVMAGVLENSSIRVLRMTMGYWELSSEGAKIIANALCSGKCTIEELDLRGNFELEDEGCVVIMKALRNNNSIFKLDLSYCGIGDVGMKGMAKVLQNNHAPCLRTLSLSYNQNIGVEGFKAIAIAISQNSSLEDLDLSYCHVCDGGCIALMNALSQNASLKALNLPDCEIGNEGGKAVANFLKSNVGSIHELNLQMNDLDEELLIEIAHALHFNTHLTKLSLGLGENMGEEFWMAFDDVAHHNYSLQELGIYYNFENYRKSIEKNLDLNKKLGPVKAEMVKTGSFPCRILPCLTTASCFVEALSKVTSLGNLSPVFDLVCEQPKLFDFNDCVGERPTKKEECE